METQPESKKFKNQDFLAKIYFYCLFLLAAQLCNPFLCFAQSDSLTHKDSIKLEIEKAIRYLSLSQIKNTSGHEYYQGEWQSYIINLDKIFLLGPKGKSAFDSNCFTTASIHNILADYYLRNSAKKEILPMLELAQKNIQTYVYNQSYNFWHLIDNPPYLKGSRFVKIKQHRANRFNYRTGLVNRYAHIYNDADDTAIGLLAELLYLKAARDSNIMEQSKVNLMERSKIFFNYIDSDKRNNISLYNYYNGYKNHTGAFLTWFGEERRFNPLLWFFPFKGKQNIIFGANDVDCVVNANVIYTLLSIGNYNASDLDDAISYINHAIRNNHYNTCGNYYPTEFNLHYAVSKSISLKDTVFDSCSGLIIDQIISAQNSDGSWSSYTEPNRLQATLFASLALINIGCYEKYNTIESIKRAVRYVRSRCFIEGEVNYWPGGIFFSGGSVVRYNHVWKSDAYTTALCIELLDRYLTL